jgi:hypothetical protein
MAHADNPPLLLETALHESPESDAVQRPTTHKAEGKGRPSAENGPKVAHQPQQPKTGQPVRITIDTAGRTVPSGGLVVEYQVVEPGKYIARADAAFEKNWVSLAMRPAEGVGDGTNGAGVYTAEIPGSVQRHRRLIRYRVRSLGNKKIITPAESDSEPNLAYFVYDGVPAWKGAINPRSDDAQLSQPVTYSSAVMQSVPVYHFLSSKAAVEKVTWSSSDGFGNGDRNAYRYTGTMVYDGVVYDHVGFRARGGGWRHAMGKNMWKFNFLPGHRFQARDNYGQSYKTKWDKLNLGACIQQGDYGMRGEQGMFESLGFRLFNRAGKEASRTHWVELRIIDEAEESPADQYHGDFWGLYLAVENVDQHFLKEHDLPAGNVYKLEFGAKTAFNGNPAITNQSDVHAFMGGISRQQRDSWWTENVDLARYYDYRAIIECIHHYDVDAGKNYFYYLNPETKKWAVIPWDLDLTWGESMYGGGREPFYAAGLLFRPAFKRQYQERLAELRDLLFNADEIGRLIDEYAAIISDPNGGPCLADADRAKWDYHPIFSSHYVMAMKTSPGLFYFHSARNRFPVMVKYMKTYAARRANWIDSTLLAGYQPPPSPKVAPGQAGDSTNGALTYRVEPGTAGDVRTYRWRLAEVTDPKSTSFERNKPWKYEIDALWEQEGPQLSSATLPREQLLPGHSYRVRARYQDGQGAWSRWSRPVQFTMPGQ